jgi:hypothetical protein
MSPQTPRPPAPKPIPDRRFAQDVAKHLDRRRMRRKLLLWALLIGAIVLAALYLTCGRGFGLGGLGKGKGEGEGEGSGPGSVSPLLSTIDAGLRRCQIRVAAGGITIDGKQVTVDEAVAACKDAAAADVFVTGGARRADRKDLTAAFERAGIQIWWGGPMGSSAADGAGSAADGAGSAADGAGSAADGAGSAGSAGSAGP